MSFLGMRRIYIVCVPVLVLSLVMTVIPVDGDGGFVPVANFNVYEPGQNAILCWNGHHERMYLSINIYADQPTEGIHFVPFPSLPKISLGDLETFKRLNDVFDRRLDYSRWDYQSDGYSNGMGGSGGSSDSFKVHLDVTLGKHNVTVIEIIDPDDFKQQIGALMGKVGMTIEHWPEGLEDVLVNYTMNGFKFFAVDRFQIGNRVASVEPLIYDFITDELVFPLEISSILKGRTSLQLAIITAEEHPIDLSSTTDILTKKGEGVLYHSDILEVDPELQNLFPARGIGMLYEGYISLSELEGDFIISSKTGIHWTRAVELTARYESNDGMYPPTLLLYGGSASYRDNQLIMIDENNGRTIWEIKPYDIARFAAKKYLSRKVVLEDVNGNGKADLVLMDYNRETAIVTRLNPVNGELIWQTQIGITSYIMGTLTLEGEEEKGSILFYTQNTLYAVDLDHGYNWSKGFVNNIFQDRAPEVIDTKNVQLVMVRDSSPGHTSIYSPWAGKVHEVWDTSMAGGEIIPYHGYDLLMFNELGIYFFLNGATGECVFSYQINGAELMDCYRDNSRPGQLNGILMSTGVNGLNITKVSISTLTREWSTVIGRDIGTPLDLYDYEPMFNDFNRDGYSDIVISHRSSAISSNQYYLDSNLTTFVLDGRTGDLEFRSSGRFLGLKGWDSSGGSQMGLNEYENITIFEMGSWKVLNTIKKMYEGTGEILVSMGDMNNDGYTDLVTKTYTRSPYYPYRPYYYVGDTFFNGYLSNAESFVDVDSYYSYSNGCIISGRSGKLLYREGYRLYSKAIEAMLMMEVDSETIHPGETAQFYLRFDDRDIPVTSETLVLDSDWGTGSFSDLREILPGFYSFRWTAPRAVVGPVTISAKIMIDSKILCSSRIEMTIVTKEVTINPIEDLDMEIWLDRMVTELNGPIFIEVKVNSEYDAMLLDIMIHDLSLCAMVNQPVQISKGRYIGMVTPIRNVEMAGILLEVSYNGEIIERKHWNVVVFENETVQTDPQIKVGNLQVFPSMVASGEPVLLFLPISTVNERDDIRIICDDGGRGGYFSGKRTLMGSLILVDYYTPSTTGVINITIDIYDDSRYISTGVVSISVVDEERADVITPDELEIEYDTTDIWIDEERITHVYINVSRFGSHLEVVNYVQISHITRIAVQQGSVIDNVTLHLVLQHVEDTPEDLMILIWDEYGTSEILTLDLGALNDPSNSEEVDDEINTPRQEGNSAQTMLMIITTVFMICTAVLVMALGFTIKEYRREKLFLRPEGPASERR